MPVLYNPPGGPLAITGGTVQTTKAPPDTKPQGIRQYTMKLVTNPADPGMGINIPVIVAVGYYEDDSGQVQLAAFDNFGQGVPPPSVVANSQVRATHPAIIFNLDAFDPWTQKLVQGTGDPVVMFERVDQFAVYDPLSVQTIITQNDPLNTDPDGAFQGSGQVSVYAIDNVDGEIANAAQPQGSSVDVFSYPSIDHGTPPSDFSMAGSNGGVHDKCHTVRIYGGLIQVDDSGNYIYDNNGDVAIDLDQNGDVWVDIQYIDICDVIDDDGQERYFTLTMNPVQDQFQYPSDDQYVYPQPFPGPMHVPNPYSMMG